MTATGWTMKGMARKMERSLMFPVKVESEENEIGQSDDDFDLNDLLSMPLPSISGGSFLLSVDADNEFLRLTTMVRTVYLSYLHKCLLSNYIVCYKQREKALPCNKLKKCADQLELNAVRCSLEASLYRQQMLKLISDVKTHTSEKKVYKRLLMFLEAPPERVDVGTQTTHSWLDLQKSDNIQSVCVSSNCEELSPKQISADNEEQSAPKENESHDIPPSPCNKKTASPTVNSTSCFDKENAVFNHELDRETVGSMLIDETVKQETSVAEEACAETSLNSELMISQASLQDEDDHSQDSLLQHMEDMFCESDDSSDLTTLIEKHSGITKANVDKEINKMCSETTEPFIASTSNQVSQGNNAVKSSAVKPANVSQGKYSFSYYKEMKNREANKATAPTEIETAETKHKRRTSDIWFVERVHQVSKLKAKMTELSLRNYRKHGRVKQKFIELFGESDDEDMMPDSPICIEEHLTACKERIAPWIVKYLMPFYKKRRIKDRLLFKAVAKHIADMLIIENTFPEQDCVSKYVEGYFKNKRFIKTKQDIYL